MENATKALLMAGGLLIAILVASFMMFVLRKAGVMTAQYDVQRAENELASFNGQFEVYAKNDNTFFDIITVANLAYDINKKNGYDANNSVSIRIVKTNGATEYSILPNSNLAKNYFFEKEDVNKPIYIYDDSIIGEYTKTKDDPENIQYVYSFNCIETTYNDITGKVNGMRFEIVQNN